MERSLIENYKDISKLLKFYRESKGMSVREVAKKLNQKSHQSYYQYETNPKKISLHIFDKILKAFELELLIIVLDKKPSEKQLQLIKYVIDNPHLVESMLEVK